MLVVQSPEGDSWLRLLRAGGLAATEEPFGYLPTDSAAVVPDDLKLSAYDVSEAKAWVAAGGRLVTADPVLLGRLGARLSQPVPATGATMEGLAGSATWASTTPVQAVYPPARLRDGSGDRAGTDRTRCAADLGPVGLRQRPGPGSGRRSHGLGTNRLRAAAHAVAPGR